MPASVQELAGWEMGGWGDCAAAAGVEACSGDFQILLSGRLLLFGAHRLSIIF